MQIEDWGVNSAISFMQVGLDGEQKFCFGKEKNSVWHLLLSYLEVRLQAQPILQGKEKKFQLRKWNISVTKENLAISILDPPTFVIFV